MNDAERDLLNAVLANPADDDPRLVMADFFDETGRPERGEFVRLSIKLKSSTTPAQAKMMLPSYVSFGKLAEPMRRHSELLIDNFTKWIDADWIEMVGQPIVEWVLRRGFIEAIKLPLAVFMGGPCTYDLRAAGGFGARGIPCDRDDCQKCKGTGRIEGLAKRIGETWPVTKVVLTDRKPQQYPSNRTEGAVFGWIHERPGREFNLPNDLYDRLTAFYRNGWWRDYYSEKSALDALSDAAVSHMRQLANLTPIPGTVPQSTARAS